MTITKPVLVALLFFLAASVTVPITAVAESQTSVPSNTPEPSPPPETTLDDQYVIQPGDVLGISVWREPTLDKDVVVRPDGALNFPLVDNIIAAGKTIEQLRKELVEKLSKFVPNPVVLVSIRAVAGNKIYVVGKVNKPGEYATNRPVDVMQILSMAGGLSPYASENNIKILRRENGELKSIPFRYSRVEKGKDLDQNIILRGGDIVVVP